MKELMRSWGGEETAGRISEMSVKQVGCAVGQVPLQTSDRAESY